MFCEVVEELGGVLFPTFFSDALGVGFGDDGFLSCFGAGFQPLECEADVLGC